MRLAFWGLVLAASAGVHDAAAALQDLSLRAFDAAAGERARIRLARSRRARAARGLT